jgi:flavin-dependent dehydrogenase
MKGCDVLIVGGGPAGSSCAWRLRRLGLDVIVMDRAEFPRDKVCAGWITPPVIDDLDIDVADYRRGRTFQPITAFRTGIIGRVGEIETIYPGAVSFGIRRCEFDQYLLQRSGARLQLGMPVNSVRRDGHEWIVNDAVRAHVVIGAGGHFCPVARQLNADAPNAQAPVVVAREAEFAVSDEDAGGYATAGERPELYFNSDMTGYGWAVRKQGHLNVGYGHLNPRALPRATEEFISFLESRGVLPPKRAASWTWRGHAYRLSDHARRRIVADGVMLVGDAAGLAYPQSGEGIRPAIESGLMAADVVADAGGCYTADRLSSYSQRLAGRFPPAGGGLETWIPAGLRSPLAVWLMNRRSFVRHVVLNGWFLHSREPRLATAPS